MKQCAWCSKDFEPAVSYQIYCSEECRVAATKHKQSEKYRERKLKSRRKKVRYCKNGCGNKLSVYNDSDYCVSCFFSERSVIAELDNIKRRIDGNEDG